MPTKMIAWHDASSFEALEAPLLGSLSCYRPRALRGHR